MRKNGVEAEKLLELERSDSNQSINQIPIYTPQISNNFQIKKM